MVLIDAESVGWRDENASPLGEGRRRAQHFGTHDELALGVEIGFLLGERAQAVS